MKLSDAIIANKTNRVGFILKENQKKVVFEVGELISKLDSGGPELWWSQAHTFDWKIEDSPIKLWFLLDKHNKPISYFYTRESMDQFIKKYNPVFKDIVCLSETCREVNANS